MNLKLLQGYVLAVLSLLVLAAAGFLLLNNLGGAWRMQVFWRPVTLWPATWLLLAGAGGLVVWWTITKLLPGAVAALRAGAKLRRQKRLDQLARGAQQPPQSTAEPGPAGADQTNKSK